MCKSKEEAIKRLCKTAEMLCLDPWNVADPNITKFGLVKEDFIYKIPEDVYGTVIIGIKDWVPASLSDNYNEYQAFHENERFKTELVTTLYNLPKEEYDRFINKIIENYQNEISYTWKDLAIDLATR